MKFASIIILLSFSFSFLLAQETIEQPPKIYNPDANALADISKAIDQAKKENKHVMIQVGGNWCPWCIKFHSYIKEHHELDSLIRANYIFLLVNYSREKQNLEVLQQLEYPQRFGFPVLIILDENGQRIHTQDSGYLEQDKSYNYDRVKRFILNWTKTSVNPDTYNKSIGK